MKSLKRTGLAAIALAGIVGLLATGCSSSAEPSGHALESLTVAIPQEASNFDPVISTEVPATEPMRNVFETLITQDGKGNPAPMLAESYKQAEDNMSISFTLRQGVKFHDGSTMTADDVVASMSRWLQYSSAATSAFKGATMEKVSDSEVVMKLATANSAATLVLSYGESSIPYITKAAIAQAAAGQPVTQYVGTGPFEFVAWNKGQNLELKRFADYTPAKGKADGLAGDRTATFDKLVYEFTPDPSTQIAGLQSGKYDVAQTVPYDNYDQLAADSSLTLELTEKTALPNLYFNKKEGFFVNVKAREALAVGLDREAMLKAGYANEKFYKLSNGCMMPPVSEAQWPCDKSNAPGKPDAAKAKKLLSEAGYNGETIRIITSRDAGRAYQVSTVLQQQLKELGVDAKLETFDYATLNSKRAEPGSWELIVINNIVKVEPLQLFYVPPKNPGWTDGDLLAPIIAAYQSAPSPEARQKVYTNEMQKWYSSYIPIVNLGSASDLYATKSSITGITAQGSTLILWKATAK